MGRKLRHRLYPRLFSCGVSFAFLPILVACNAGSRYSTFGFSAGIASVDLRVSGTAQFSVQGGVAPYSYRVNGWGTVDAQGKYTAPSSLPEGTEDSTATDIVSVTDSVGEVLSATVTVRASGDFDNSFGTNGFFTRAVSPSDWDDVRAILPQDDGKIVSVLFMAGGGCASNSCFAASRMNADGTLDASFGVGGVAVMNVGGPWQYVYGGAMQSDGKILIVGSDGASAAMTIVRFLTSGLADTSFDSDGMNVVDVSSAGRTSTARAVAVQSDGKIIVAGEVSSTQTTGAGVPYHDVALMRLTSAGALDSSFGSSGIVVVPHVNNQDYMTDSLTLQSDGKIVVSGTEYTGNGTTGTNNHFIFRFESDGQLDATFNGDGKLMFPSYIWGMGSVGHTKLAMQDDGKILFAGVVSVYPMVKRFNADGSTDSTFGSSGTVTLSQLGPSSSAYSQFMLHVQDNGKIFIGASGYSTGHGKAAILKLTRDGLLDSNFGPSGFKEVVSTTHYSDVKALAQLPTGQILLGGSLFPANAGSTSEIDSFWLKILP